MRPLPRRAQRRGPRPLRRAAAPGATGAGARGRPAYRQLRPPAAVHRPRVIVMSRSTAYLAAPEQPASTSGRHPRRPPNVRSQIAAQRPARLDNPGHRIDRPRHGRQGDADWPRTIRWPPARWSPCCSAPAPGARSPGRRSSSAASRRSAASPTRPTRTTRTATSRPKPRTAGPRHCCRRPRIPASIPRRRRRARPNSR